MFQCTALNNPLSTSLITTAHPSHWSFPYKKSKGKSLTKTLNQIRGDTALSTQEGTESETPEKRADSDEESQQSSNASSSASTETKGSSSSSSPAVSKNIKKTVLKTAATFAPRASSPQKNPAVPGTALYTVFEVQGYVSMVLGGVLSFNLLFPSNEPDIWRLMGMWSIWMFRQIDLGCL
eukprot:TRINITY_DN3055_c0_g1_i4.p1 TRINITY_DN3055_c0_g1~~TRINITY_DN3055_c0_g1_i4.p1  ORF type:complete len:180 (+),score=28.53 TRINITY_DN3055_c0_g1_i4:155-694(+)